LRQRGGGGGNATPLPTGRGEGTQLAFVLDWQLVLTSGLTDFTFSSATNYVCNGTIRLILCGTTRIQGGTVVKFAPLPAAAVLNCFGPIICDTEPYRPAFFVSKFDTSVGEILDYGNTTPATYSGAIQFNTTGNKLKHLRIRHANTAIRGPDIDIRHSQITHCGTVLYTDIANGSGPCRLGNVLVHNSG
jgi:hypothetical protein